MGQVVFLQDAVAAVAFGQALRPVVEDRVLDLSPRDLILPPLAAPSSRGCGCRHGQGFSPHHDHSIQLQVSHLGGLAHGLGWPGHLLRQAIRLIRLEGSGVSILLGEHSSASALADLLDPFDTDLDPQQLPD